MTALVQAFAARLGAAWSGGSLMTLMTEGVSVFFSSLVALMMGLPLVLGLVALFCLTYAQVIWAQVALAIVILLGPVFIPWLLFEPLAFLFWGWFRTLMVYTLYGVVAGAILRVFMGVGMGYVTTYTGALMGTGSSDPAELGLWVVVLLPLVVSGLMAGMKVGELAAMLVSGSGSVGSGIDGARGARRRTPQRCREPGPPPSPRRLKETSMNREHDAGREYAEIWGETVEANRKLRTLATILAAACLALGVLLLRVATVEPPRPDRRAGRRGRPRRGRGLRGRNGPGGSARSHDQVFPEPVHRRLLFAGGGRRSSSTGPGASASSRPSWRTPRSRGTALGSPPWRPAPPTPSIQVEQVVLRIHPAPEAPHGATADFDLVHFRQGQETLRERWSITLRFTFLTVIPSELVVYNPMGILITYLQADRALVTEQPR